MRIGALCRAAGVIALAARAWAAPGELDTTFGGSGIVRTPAGGEDVAYSGVLQADGRIVIAGSATGLPAEHVTLVRYNSDGSLDSGFGSGGIVATAVGSGVSRAVAVGVQSDGKLLAAGNALIGSFDAIIVVRYLSDGSLDPSFDGDGIASVAVGSRSAQATALVVQPDGRIVVAGYAQDQFALIRLRADGALDPSFGGGDGIVMTDVASGSDDAFALALQPDGKLVAAGWAVTGSNYDFAVVRYLSDGSLDTSFDGDGKVITSFGTGLDVATSLVVQPDGKIVAVGSAQVGANREAALARYHPNGSLDASFGSGGRVTTALGASNGLGVALQPNGRIVVAGWADVGSWHNVALLRFLPDGSLDPSLQGSGVVKTRVGAAHDLGVDLALQPDGKFVVFGRASNGSNDDFVVLRYRGDATCGNAVMEAGEQCDDGNLADGDCCSPQCQLDAGGTPCTADASPCTPDVCDAAGMCTHAAGNANVVCRIASGDCDVAERCDGVASVCPPDAVQPAATVCRAALDVCDAPEACDGATVGCPADQRRPAGTLCRAALGSCDLSESCDGVQVECPPDALQPANTPCRSAVGVCDSAEACDGVTPSCPADSKRTGVCRIAAGVCDAAEDCDGAGVDCPADAALGDGTPCPDDLFCDGAERCQAGACVAGPPPCALACDEERDACRAGCPVEPRADCRGAARSLFQLSHAADSARDGLRWTWQRGAATAGDEFGQPPRTTDYSLCLYAATGGGARLEGVTPASSKWVPSGARGWRYRDPGGAAAGIQKIKLRGGASGRASITIKGGGALLPDLALPLAPTDFPLRLQWVGDDVPACWESVFDAARRNDASRLILRAD
ncbi:MAG: hypothetical protein SF182_02310 [Deltaproteobacteria bacterium]|nr:hypothetical protein [Deltaproteobacteria bacterium]